MAIAFTVLGFPGEAFTEGMPLQLVSKALQSLGLPWLPGPFDELHHSHTAAMAEGAQGQTQCCGGFAFALAGVDQHKAFFNRALTNPLGLHLFAPLHALAIGGIVFFRCQLTPHAKGCRGGIQVAVGRGCAHGLWAVMRCKA